MKTNTVTRFGITKINKDGQRQLAVAAQGRNMKDTRAEAEEQLRQILSNNSKSTLESVYGDISKMTVEPFECYAEHGDPVGIYA